MSQDVFDELNVKIAGVCEVVERECDRLLDALCSYSPVQWDPDERKTIARLALDYAQWAHMLEGYRGMLRSGSAPIARVK